MMEKVFSVTEKGSSVIEKVSSETEHGSSVNEKVSSAPEKVFSVADPTSPKASLGVFLRQKWTCEVEFIALASRNIIGGAGIPSRAPGCLHAWD